MTARLPLAALRGPRQVAAVALALGTLVAACGDDGSASDDDAVRLEASLGFLTSDYEFSSDQVGCVREQLERRVPAAEIRDLDDQLRAIDLGVVAIDDLPTDQASAVTASIATCAVSE